jgi:flagellar basal body P-ring formation protein FlgA
VNLMPLFRRLALALAALLAHAPAQADLVLSPGEPFTRDGAERLLGHAAADRLGLDEIAFAIEQPVLPLNNPSTRRVHLAVAELRTDPLTGRFDAQITVQVEGGPTNWMTLQGRAEPMIEVATMRETVSAGTVLAAGDFETRRLPASAVPEDAVLDAGSLVGLEAVRRLSSGRAIRPEDVQEATLIHRDKVVTILFEREGLRLAALGRAVEDGSRGSVVRVVNLDSRREIRAVVTGPGEASVLTGGGAL